MRDMDQNNEPNTSDRCIFSPVGPDEFTSVDVGYVASEFLHYRGRPFYPVGALAKARVMRVWLGMGSGLVATRPDLIFAMPPFEYQSPDFRLYEIVLRTTWGASYGGWVFGSKLRVASDFWSGHRVLHTEYRGESLQFDYDVHSGQYLLRASECVWLNTDEIRSMAKARQRA